MIDLEILAFESMEFFLLNLNDSVQSLDRLDQLRIVPIMATLDGISDLLRLRSLGPSVDNLETFPVQSKGDVVERPLLGPMALV